MRWLSATASVRISSIAGGPFAVARRRDSDDGHQPNGDLADGKPPRRDMGGPKSPQPRVPYCVYTVDLRRIAASCQRDVPKSLFHRSPRAVGRHRYQH